MQQLTGEDVVSALAEMGEALLRAHKIADIALYGGAAIMLQFEASFRTKEVDAVVEAGDHGAVMQAVRIVADRRGWLRSWFSEAVSAYIGCPDGVAFHGSYPSEGRVGLRVYVAKPDHLLAMKLRAMRTGSRDEADAVMLARACGITTFDAMIRLLGEYFPRQPPDARRVVIVGQFAETFNAPPSYNAG